MIRAEDVKKQQEEKVAVEAAMKYMDDVHDELIDEALIHNPAVLVDALARALGFHFADGGYVRTPRRQRAPRRVRKVAKKHSRFPKEIMERVMAMEVGSSIEIGEELRAAGVSYASTKNVVYGKAYTLRQEGHPRRYSIARNGVGRGGITVTRTA